MTQIPGIGRQTAKDLLAAFGSVANLTQAEDSEILKIPRMGKERLEAIRQIFPGVINK